MLRLLFCAILLCALPLLIFAQTPSPFNKKSSAFTFHDMVKEAPKGIKPLAEGDEGNPAFVTPNNLLIKLGRQLEFQLLPQGFYPKDEPEKDPQKRKFIRYAIAYYRDCEVIAFSDLRDVLLGVRFDTRDGFLDTKYYHVYLSIDPLQAQFVENSSGLGVASIDEGTAFAFFLLGEEQTILSIKGVFQDPSEIQSQIGTDDFDGLTVDPDTGKVAIYVRKGGNSSGVFLLLADPALKNIEQVTLLNDVPATSRAFIFKISDGVNTTFRGGEVPASANKK